MAQVPYSPLPDAQAAGVPNDYQSINASPGAFGGYTARAEQQLGGALNQSSDSLARTALFVQGQNNEAAARDASTQFMTEVGKRWAQYRTLEGKAAVDGYQGFSDGINQLKTQIAGGLQSQEAKNLFLNQSSFMSSRMMMGASSYAADQQKAYWVQSHRAHIENAAQMGTLMSNDPTSVELASHMIEDSTAQIGQLSGWDDERLRAETAAAKGKYFRQVIESQAARDPALAMHTFQTYRGQMDGQSQAVIEHSLRADADRQSVAAGVNSVIGGQSSTGAAQGSAVSAVWQRLVTYEHGESATGQSLVSPAGARGLTQLMPETAKEVAKQHGVPYDEQALMTDRGYNHMIGRLYFSDLMVKYNGNATLASAAYNAGPGAVDKWIAAYGDPRKGVISDADFAAKIPIDETRKYVMNVAQPSAVPAVPQGAFVKPGASGSDAPNPAPSIAGTGGATAAAVPASALPNGATPAVATTGAPTQPGNAPAATTHQPDAYGQEMEMVQRAWTEAQQRFPDRPDLQRQMVNGVYQHIQITNSLQAKYESETAKAQHDQQLAAGNQIITTMIKDPDKFDPKMIADNPYLTWEQKASLFNMAQAHLSNNRDTKTYGTGFYNLYSQIHAPDGDPNKITSPSQLWGHVGPNGDLTVAGVDRLTQELAGKRTPESEAESKMKAGAIAYAKHQLTFSADFGVTKIRDPHGEDIFNTGFLPAFFKAYDAGIQAGKSPYQLLSKDSPDFIIDKLVSTYKRSPAQLSQDQLLEGAGTANSTQSAAPQKYDLGTKDGIVGAYKAGKITRDQASEMLVSKGFAAAAQPAGAPPQ